jgi:thiol-disulfide isomerase/thioredoxin
MKKQLTCIALLFITLTTYAQAPIITLKRIGRTVEDEEKMVVKDSLGVQYTFKEWHNKIITGDYKLVLLKFKKADELNTNDREYVLVRYTAAQKEDLKKRIGKPLETPYFTTGEAIKPFKVRAINGKKITPKDWTGKTVVLNFWFINCPPCRQELPGLNKIVEKYTNNANVLFIGIALDSDSEVKEFIKGNPYNYLLVADGREYAGLFNIKSYPTNVVIDKAGKVRFHSSGYWINTIDWIEKTIAESETEQ